MTEMSWLIAKVRRYEETHQELPTDFIPTAHASYSVINEVCKCKKNNIEKVYWELPSGILSSGDYLDFFMLCEDYFSWEECNYEELVAAYLTQREKIIFKIQAILKDAKNIHSKHGTVFNQQD